MNRFLQIASRLAIICAVAAVVLSIVDALTAPVIEQRKAAELKQALSSLVEGGVVGDPKEIDDHPVVKKRYPVTTDQGKDRAVILELAGGGYGGEMKIIASYTFEGTVISVVLMDNTETPGLGKKAEEPGYMDKYIGTGHDGPVPSRKDQLSGEEADSVTGATITFAGIGQALDAGSRFVKEGETE